MNRHLAQFNIARLRAPLGNPQVQGFVDGLDIVNSLAMRMPGFVWMMDGINDPGGFDPDAPTYPADPLIVPNLTVWEDAESLERFVWGTVHKKFYDRRKDWFEALDEMHLVMWWIEEGHRPTLEEAKAKLAQLRSAGDTETAFGWAWLKAAISSET